MKQPKEIIQIGQLEIRILLDGDDTNNQMVLFESVFPAGAKVALPPHYHTQADETGYVLEGRLTVTLDGEKNEYGPGESCFIPRGTIHHVANNTEETARGIVVFTPALIGPSFFREVSEIFGPGKVPDMDKITEILLRNDTIPVTVNNNIENVAISA